MKIYKKIYTLVRNIPFVSDKMIGIVKHINKIKYSLKNHKNKPYQEYQNIRPLGPRKYICYAPFVSLYFGMHGKITACCLNRSKIFGTYPETSIKNALESQEIVNLKNALKQNNLDYGCFHCKQRIQSKNYDAVEAKLYDTFKPKKDKPVYFIFEMENTCNLNCMMCNSLFSSTIEVQQFGKRSAENPYDDLFIEELKEYIPDLIKMKFLGGEPFLIKNYYKIWRLAVEKNPDCIIDIQTNGTVLSDEIKDLIEKGNFRISVSLESFDEKNYETIRKKGNFKKVIENLNYFKEHARRHKYPFCIAVCPIKQNFKEIPDIIRKCNEEDTYIYFNTVWLPAECSLYYLNHKELNEIVEFYRSQHFETKTDVEKKNKYHFECLMNQLDAWRIEKFIQYENRRNIINLWQEDSQKASEMPLEKLITLLSKHAGNPEKEEIYTQKIQNVAKRFENEEILKLTLYYLLNYPSDLLKIELDGYDEDALFIKANETYSYYMNKKNEIERLKEENEYTG